MDINLPTVKATRELYSMMGDKDLETYLKWFNTQIRQIHNQKERRVKTKAK